MPEEIPAALPKADDEDGADTEVVAEDINPSRRAAESGILYVDVRLVTISLDGCFAERC